MDFSIKFDTFKSGWSNVTTEGPQVMISKIMLYIFHSLKINFYLLNSADPDEMPHFVAFHLGFHCLSEYLLTGIQTS